MISLKNIFRKQKSNQVLEPAVIKPELDIVQPKRKQSRSRDGHLKLLKKLYEFPSALSEQKVFAGNDYLANELGISVRTIQRYLKVLSEQDKIKIEYGLKREIILLEPAEMAKPQARGIKKRSGKQKSNVTHDTIVAPQCHTNGVEKPPQCRDSVTHISLSNRSNDLIDVQQEKQKYPAAALADEDDPFWVSLIEEAKRERAAV